MIQNNMIKILNIFKHPIVGVTLITKLIYISIIIIIN